MLLRPLREALRGRLGRLTPQPWYGNGAGLRTQHECVLRRSALPWTSASAATLTVVVLVVHLLAGYVTGCSDLDGSRGPSLHAAATGFSDGSARSSQPDHDEHRISLGDWVLQADTHECISLCEEMRPVRDGSASLTPLPPRTSCVTAGTSPAGSVVIRSAQWRHAPDLVQELGIQRI
jgi:hypothetical protein